MGASMHTGNRGVSALGASLVGLLGDAFPEADAIMLIGSRDSKAFEVTVSGGKRSVPIVNFRQSPAANPRENLFVIGFLALAYRLAPWRGIRRLIVRNIPWIKAVESADLVGDIRGGDSFSDIYGLRSFVLASIPVLAVIWIRGDIVLFPQTYGPYRHSLARRIARYIVRHASLAMARDRESLETACRIAGVGTRVRFCPDVAFSLIPGLPPLPVIDPPIRREAGDCLIGLNVNGLMYNGGYTRRNMFGLKLDYPEFLRRLMEALLADRSMRILLVPHTFAAHDSVESDPAASRQVLRGVPEGMRQRVHMVEAEYDQHELKGLIGGCDFFIGSRMHSCIAALSQSVPTVGVAYSKKFKGVFDTVGAGDWVIDGRDVDTEGAVREIVAKVAERSAMGRSLRERVGPARMLLQEAFLSLRSDLSGRPARAPAK